MNTDAPAAGAAAAAAPAAAPAVASAAKVATTAPAPIFRSTKKIVHKTKNELKTKLKQN